MLLQYALIISSLLGSIFAQDTNLATVKSIFDLAHIPGDLNIVFDPKVLLGVTFPQLTGLPITLHAGIQLPRNATAGPPVYSVVGPAGKGPFVVAVVDPDAPTPQSPNISQVRHFLGGNFEVKMPKELWVLTNNTPAISEFLQPSPPAGSDPHRYIFLLFEQPKAFDNQTLVTPTTPIFNFNISTFADASRLGSPLGGTFMRVGPDQ